jgi:hypothetical protein
LPIVRSIALLQAHPIKHAEPEASYSLPNRGNVPNAKVISNESAGHFMIVSKLRIDHVGINGESRNDDPPRFDLAAAISDAAKKLPV